MKAPKTFSIQNHIRARPALTIEQVATWWAKRNAGALAEIALRSVSEPVGTVFTIPPIRLVIFKTDEGREGYLLSLREAAKKQRAMHPVECALSQHIEDLVFFAREQFLLALSSLEAEATFQHGAVNAREEQRGR